MRIFSLLSLLLQIFWVQSHAQSFWKLVSETHPNALHSGILHLPELNTTFISTYNMGVFKSIGQGNSWQNVLLLPKDKPVNSLFLSKKGSLFVAGLGMIYRSDNKGEKWEEIQIQFTAIKNFIEDKDGNILICSVDSGGILRSSDGGSSWSPFTQGLPSNYVNNIICDDHGNIFCSLNEDRTGENGGLFFWNEQLKSWHKTDIHVNIDNSIYKVKVSTIKAMHLSTSGELFISLDGVVTNYNFTGLLRNTTDGALSGSYWKRENWNDTIQLPFTLLFENIFVTNAGHIFGCRLSGSNNSIYTKTSYSKKWFVIHEGLPPLGYVKSYFSEIDGGTVYLTSDFSNKIYKTNETVPGKKYFTINFTRPDSMRLYEFQTLKANTVAGPPVKVKSMDNKTTISENTIRATGIGTAILKAYIDGTDSSYYNEETTSFFISKAKNEIKLSLPSRITEGDTGIYVSAHASSGEEVHLKVIEGEATFVKNKLLYYSPGKIKLMATEIGNGSYDVADTVLAELCIYPKKPVIKADTLSGTVSLTSSSQNNNLWYFNEETFYSLNSTIFPTIKGIYSLKVDYEGCVSEISDPFAYLTTNSENMEKQIFSVFPIPFSDKISIQSNSSHITQIIISNMLGKKVFQSKLTGDLTHLDLNTLPTGMYIIEFSTIYNKTSFKIVKE